MSNSENPSRQVIPIVRGYALAVVSVSIALGLGFLSQRFTPRDVEFAFFQFGLAITVWYAGTGPGVLAIVLSGLSVVYFFTEPLYTLCITPADIPYFIIYILSGLLITGFSTVRRRVEREFLQSRDALAREVTERTQQAILLNLPMTQSSSVIWISSSRTGIWGRRSCTVNAHLPSLLFAHVGL